MWALSYVWFCAPREFWWTFSVVWSICGRLAHVLILACGYGTPTPSFRGGILLGTQGPTFFCRGVPLVETCFARCVASPRPSMLESRSGLAARGSGLGWGIRRSLPQLSRVGLLWLQMNFDKRMHSGGRRNQDNTSPTWNLNRASIHVKGGSSADFPVVPSS